MRVNAIRSASCALAAVAMTASIGTVATAQGTLTAVAVVTSAAFPVAVAAGTYDLVGGVQPVGLCLNYSWEGCIETYVPDLRVEVTVGCRIFRKLGPNPNKITASVDVGDTCGIGSGNVDVGIDASIP